MTSGSSIKIRSGCPVCGEPDASFICRMGRQYLLDSEQGWRYPPRTLQLAGLEFDRDPETGCTYYECSRCGTFHVKETAQMEDANAILWQEDEELRRAPENNSPLLIRGKTKRAPLIGQTVALALQSTKSDAPAVLDYGFGGGLDLGILWALRLDKVVGYNPYDYAFERVRKYLHPNVILVDNPDELSEFAPFDLVVCNSVMEHVQDPVATLDHVYQLLKPGGIAWFSAPSLTRKQMAGHARSVEQGIKVKLLHPGHLQLWNDDTLAFSTFIERRGFQIMFVDLGIPPRDLSSLKDALWLVAAHAKRSLQVSRAFVAMRTGRYKSQAFLARKIA